MQSTLEALTAELLGDVGKVHKELQRIAGILSDVESAVAHAKIEAANEVTVAIQSSISLVTKTIATEQAKADAIASASKMARQEMLQLARSTLKAELPRLRAEFHEVAIDVLRDANGLVYRSHTKRLLAAFSVCLVVAIAGGAYLGSTYFPRIPVSVQAPVVQTPDDNSSVGKSPATVQLQKSKK